MAKKKKKKHPRQKPPRKKKAKKSGPRRPRPQLAPADTAMALNVLAQAVERGLDPALAALYTSHMGLNPAALRADEWANRRALMLCAGTPFRDSALNQEVVRQIRAQLPDSAAGRAARQLLRDMRRYGPLWGEMRGLRFHGLDRVLPVANIYSFGPAPEGARWHFGWAAPTERGLDFLSLGATAPPRRNFQNDLLEAATWLIDPTGDLRASRRGADLTPFIKRLQDSLSRQLFTVPDGEVPGLALALTVGLPHDRAQRGVAAITRWARSELSWRWTMHVRDELDAWTLPDTLKLAGLEVDWRPIGWSADVADRAPLAQLRLRPDHPCWLALAEAQPIHAARPWIEANPGAPTTELREAIQAHRSQSFWLAAIAATGRPPHYDELRAALPLLFGDFMELSVADLPLKKGFRLRLIKALDAPAAEITLGALPGFYEALVALPGIADGTAKALSAAIYERLRAQAPPPKVAAPSRALSEGLEELASLFDELT